MAGVADSRVRLAIIADDLTGSLDTGVAFAARGWRTVVRMAQRGDRTDPTDPTDRSDLLASACDAIVWDTETREADEESARRRVKAVCDQPSVQSAPRVYKKIDSTLRGSWLAELHEVWKARAALTTVLCPAFPAVGRSVVDGELRVDGLPLAEAGFSGDGRLRELLLERWCGRVVSLSASQVREALLADPDREPSLLLADAATDADLDTLAQRLHEQDLDRLLCGAGGLAAAWARVLIPEPAPLPPLAPITGPIWILAGSQHPATRAQMEALTGAAESQVEWFEAHELDFARRLSGLEECTMQGLCLTHHPVRGYPPSHPLTPSPSHPLTPSFQAWATEFIAAVVAEARGRGVAGFAATGGETAALLLRAMGAQAVTIDRELLPGIPLCRIADGAWAGTPLITKAGGFGAPDALTRAVARVRSGDTGVMPS